MLSEHDQINLIFGPRRYQLTSTSYCHTHNDAFNLLVGYTAQMAA
jgi:putative transposase